MLATIAKLFLPNIIGPILDLADKYLNRQITKDQLEAQLKIAITQAFADVERAHAESLTETYKAFIGAAKDNRTLSMGWAVTLYSQLLVLLWHQVGIPAYAKFVGPWPSSGTTVDWAYALVALCLGGGAMMLRGSGGVMGQLKSLLRR